MTTTFTGRNKMIFKYSAVGIAAMVVGSLTVILAQNSANTVASGHREILLQTTQSWNGKPYTHYPTGQPQLTTIKLTIAPHTALPWHTHPFPNVVYVLSGLSRCMTRPAVRLWSFIRDRPLGNQ